MQFFDVVPTPPIFIARSSAAVASEAAPAPAATAGGAAGEAAAAADADADAAAAAFNAAWVVSAAAGAWRARFGTGAASTGAAGG